MTKIYRFFSVLLLAITFMAILASISGCNSFSDRNTKHVFLIGIDGMGLSGFEKAKTPTLDKLVSSGAISISTRGVMPTVSGPNWSSHLLGAGPEQHGITFNDWTIDNYTIEATIKDKDGYFPSIFSLLKEQKPELVTAFFYDWDALANYYNTNLIDKVEFSKGFAETFHNATPWIIENKPAFTFLYIGHPDEVGHTHAWGSEEYITALEHVDAALGDFIKSLDEVGMYEDSHFIVVTDHGVNENGHGGLSIEEIEIPWIISGQGIIEDKLIEQANNVYNTASTIAYLFNLEQPDEWIGQSVLGAFKSQHASKSNIDAYVPQPTPSLSSGIYTFGDALAFSVNDPSLKIRFTNNGNDPDVSSNLYEKPLLLLKTSKIKAASFRNDSRSRITEINFIMSKAILHVELDFAPNEKYSGSGTGIIVDRDFASSDFKDGKWLGFQESDLIANIELAKMEDISGLTVNYLNNQNSWIFPPTEIEVFASVDNINFKSVGRLSSEQILKNSKIGRNQLKVSAIPSKTKFLRLVVKNQGFCPKDHPGEGQAAWLFVDEIIVE